MSYKRFNDMATAIRAAEALGRLYAADISKPWPMPPDSYGPGRQPEPPEAYYQRYYRPPLVAIAAVDSDDGFPRPIRIELDDYALGLHGLAVQVTGGQIVTLDWSVRETRPGVPDNTPLPPRIPPHAAAAVVRGGGVRGAGLG